MQDLGIKEIDRYGQEVHRILVGQFEVLVPFFKKEEWEIVPKIPVYQCSNYITIVDEWEKDEICLCISDTYDGIIYHYIGEFKNRQNKHYCSTHWEAHNPKNFERKK